MTHPDTADIDALKDQIKLLKEAELAKFPFEKSDVVSWIDEKGKKFTGRVSYKFFNSTEKKVTVKVDLPVTRSIGWTSSYAYPDPATLQKAEVPELHVDEINDELAKLRRERAELVKSIDEQIKVKEQALKDEQKKCVHLWSDFYPTGEVRKHFVGETEVEEAECELCGATGVNC